ILPHDAVLVLLDPHARCAMCRDGFHGMGVGNLVAMRLIDVKAIFREGAEPQSQLAFGNPVPQRILDALLDPPEGGDRTWGRRPVVIAAQVDVVGYLTNDSKVVGIGIRWITSRIASAAADRDAD